MPGMITLNDNSLYGAFGIMGGFMQPQGHVQFLIGLIDDQLDPQSVIEQPRFCLEPGQTNGRVALEEGIEEETLQELKRRGHDAYIVSGMSRSVFGRGQIILRDVHGVLVGGSDSRADGCAIGI